MIRTFKPKHYRKLYGRVAGTCYLDEDGKPVIEVPYHASTRTRLHEMAHVELGHLKQEQITYQELFNTECDAEMFVNVCIGKQNRATVTLPAIYSVSHYHVVRPNEILNMAREYLADHAIIISNQEVSKLWWIIREEYAEAKP